MRATNKLGRMRNILKRKATGGGEDGREEDFGNDYYLCLSLLST